MFSYIRHSFLHLHNIISPFGQFVKFCVYISILTPIYHHKDSNEESVRSGSFGGNVYKHLMNGVTHMLPFVVGGGILIAIAFLLDDYSIDPSNFGIEYTNSSVF